MVKNRAPKMAARSLASREGIPYASARTANREDPGTASLRLVVGRDRDGNELGWPDSKHHRLLAIQGPAESGKTTLVHRMVRQALGHAEVFVCSNAGNLKVPRVAGYGDGIDSSVEVIRRLVDDMNAMYAAAREHMNSQVSARERKSYSHRLRQVMREELRQLPPHLQPRPRVLFVDDFDLLCRNWEWKGKGDIRSSSGPQVLVMELVREGSYANVRVVVAGESLSRSITHLGASRMLLGPSTLAEREAFLLADKVAEDPGRWAGLYDSMDEATHVQLVRG